MLFLVKTTEDTATSLTIGENFFLRPTPTLIWGSAVYDALIRGMKAWKYIDIPRDHVPSLDESLVFEDECLWLQEHSYWTKPITFRKTILWCVEAVLFWTIDSSWNRINWRRWEKTKGRGF